MKIWLPIKVNVTGGSSSFAHKFKQGMEKQGHQVTVGILAPKDYDTLLVSPRAPLALVLQARRAGKKIVHRLDGAYYPATPAGWLFPVYNAPLATIQLFSHHTVYQSQYARRICQRLVGPRRATHTSIIYNGVDTAVFSPRGPRQNLRTAPGQPIFFTAQQFRRHDQIMPLVEALTAFQNHYNKNGKLLVAGDFVGPAARLPTQLKHNPAIQLLGPIKNSDVPSYLRAADAFLYCHPNPACPNNVLEAMACGLPIVGVADGAMPEIVRHERDGFLVQLPGGGHLVPRPFDATSFADAMHFAYAHKAALAASTRARIISTFSLDHMVTHYAKALTTHG